MRKIALYALTLVTMNAFAAGVDMSSAIAKSLNQQNNNGNSEATIVYGGKDFSNPVIASAHQSLWNGQVKTTG